MTEDLAAVQTKLDDFKEPRIASDYERNENSHDIKLASYAASKEMGKVEEMS